MISGKAVAAALVLALTLSAQAWAQQVAVWQAPVPDEMLAAQPAGLSEALTAQGYQVQMLETDDLLDAQKLAPDRVSLLVIPTIGVYPRQGLPVLEEYLKAGGCFLSLGGRPFDRPLSGAGGQWQLVGIPASPPGQVKVIADFEQVVPALIRLSGGAEGERMLWEQVPDEQGEGTCLRLTLEDLAQYEYAGFPMADTGDASFTMLHFRARADENTPLLGLEMQEEDGSRWKLVLPIGTQWRDYNIFIPHFLSYASEERGGPGDYLHPERLRDFLFGYTRTMVGEGPHTLYVDDVERWQFTPPDPQAIILPRSVMDATARYYGRTIKLPEDEAPALLRVFEGSTPFEGASLQGTGQADICAAGATLAGTHDGWLLDLPTDDGPAYPTVTMSKNRIARLVPILTARDGQGELGVAASAAMVYGGELAGACWACFGLNTTDVLGEASLRDAVLGTVEYLMKRPRIVALFPTFGVADGHATMTLTATVAAGPGAVGPAKVELRVDSADAYAPPRQVFEQTIEPGKTAEFELVATPDSFDWTCYRAVAEASSADGLVDREALDVDTAAVMRRLCDFFVEAQQEDGQISRAGCVDQRAARGLLAMHEMTGNQAYLDAAIRWGELELREQREDGGYRMGYGITDQGEACYVADGGEIAIGVARLVKYLPTERRQAYIESLRRYFQYREDFRLPDGSIAVGWVFSKRYTQEGGEERSETPLRSDKSFTFVIGCTLASAAAWQKMTGQPADREMALRDAQRFIDDLIKATSVFGEAAQWTHYFLDDEAMRAAFAERMEQSLLPFVATPTGWWYAAGGRSGVTLGALNYYYTQVERSPEALAGLMHGLYYTVADQSPSGLLKVIAARPNNQDEWKYLCYSSISLAEVLQPLITMRDISGG